jgi:hypothetical protein
MISGQNKNNGGNYTLKHDNVCPTKFAYRDELAIVFIY